MLRWLPVCKHRSVVITCVSRTTALVDRVRMYERGARRGTHGSVPIPTEFGDLALGHTCLSPHCANSKPSERTGSRSLLVPRADVLIRAVVDDLKAAIPTKRRPFGQETFPSFLVATHDHHRSVGVWRRQCCVGVHIDVIGSPRIRSREW